MTDRPKNHFRRLIPYGLMWGAFTGAFFHIWNYGLTLGPNSVAYWAVSIGIWGGAGLVWAILTAKFSKDKRPSGSDT